MEPVQKKQRLTSLDTYRGLVLALLCLEATRWDWVHVAAHAYPESRFWAFMEHHFSHVAWVGCSLWDLVQPSFMFVVGVAMAYSYAKRQREGDSYTKMLGHASRRALVLIILGVFLRSSDAAQTYWTFEDVITQIGLGYVALFLLWGRGFKAQLGAAGGILLAYWLLFALTPIGDPAGWKWEDETPHLFSGFLAHWNINANPAHYFDLGFLNLFPREEAFTFHPEGYNTLNFIPSLAVMIFGLCAGELLRSERVPKQKLLILLSCGAAGILAGWLLHIFGLCPLVKKTWTPAFSLFSGGWCLVILGGLYWLIDMRGIKRWTFPLVVMGMNSIALYVMIWLIPGWIDATLQTHLDSGYAGFFGPAFEPLMQNLIVGLILWSICWWMYRRGIFLRI